MARIRDYQRSKVYQWEGSITTDDVTLWSGYMTLPEIRDFVKRICDRYRVPVPEVTDGRSRRSAAAFSYTKIAMPRSYRKPWVVCHEMAHVIKSYIFRSVDSKAKPLASHGSIFVGIYMRLLQEFLGVSAIMLTKTATEDGIDFIRPKWCDRSGLDDQRRRYRG